MLVKFAVTNYRGFANRIEWDLSEPSNYSFNTFAIKDGIIKNGIVYGPNGSGKSNFALAIFDITNHLSQKWKRANYYDNFTYTGKLNFPVDFEYTFQLGDDLLQRQYAVDILGNLLAVGFRNCIAHLESCLFRGHINAYLADHRHGFHHFQPDHGKNDPHKYKC